MAMSATAKPFFHDRGSWAGDGRRLSFAAAVRKRGLLQMASIDLRALGTIRITVLIACIHGRSSCSVMASPMRWRELSDNDRRVAVIRIDVGRLIYNRLVLTMLIARPLWRFALLH